MGSIGNVTFFFRKYNNIMLYNMWVFDISGKTVGLQDYFSKGKLKIGHEKISGSVLDMTNRFL